MKRAVVLSLGAASALAVGVLFGPSVRAGEKDEGDKKVEKGIVIRHGGGGFLGVGVGDLDGDAHGARIESVEAGSPAEKGGLQKGDVIVRFDGEAVRSAEQFARLVRETPPGRPVPVEVTRAGASQKLTVTVGEGGAMRMLGEALPNPREFHFEMPQPGPNVREWRFGPESGPMFHAMPNRPPRLGVQFTELGEQLAEYFKVEGGRGVLVTSVEAGTPAAKAGVKAGDVVLEFDGHAIQSGGDLSRAVADAEGGKELVLEVQRDGHPMDLKVTLAKPETKPHRHGDVAL